MNARDPKLIVLLFNECKRERDVEGMSQLMTDDHSLICYGHVDTTDKESSIAAWTSFFEDYPGYLNHFHRIESRDDFVVIVGNSTCPNEEFLNKPALWSAKIAGDKISEWQVYEDNVENRKRLGIG